MSYLLKIAILLAFFVCVTTVAADSPQPTLADVAYGDDPRQVLDFYQARSEQATPVLFVIHGGGWLNGDKRSFNNSGVYLAAGISVVSIEYRFVSQAAAAGVKPPVQWPLHDAARALQFVRSKANEWKLDSSRIVATGSSAGACSALWLAFHDELAEPQSSDPIARQSTRLHAVAVTRAQTTLDPHQMKAWIPNGRYGAHAFGIDGDTKKRSSAFQAFFDSRETILPWIKEYSPYELVSRGDPPVGLYYTTAPAMGEDQESPAHSANFGVGLAARLKQVGVEYELVYPGADNVRYPLIHQYVIAKLREPKP